MADLNPFARSKLKLVEPVQLVSCSFDGWSSCYQLEYRASRSAANVGLLGKQFKIGKPLVVNGRHVVVRSANFTVSNGTVDEVTVRVEALDFQAVLSGALASPVNPDVAVVRTGASVAAEEATPRPRFGAARGRRIIS